MSIVTTTDGLQNIASGLGTSAGKRAFNHFNYGTMGDWRSWDAAYQTNWIARQIVDVPAEDMTREWRTINCTDAETIRRVEVDHSIALHVQEALTWARLYGGGAVLLITGQDLTQPLKLDAIRKGDLKRCIVFDRYDMSSASINTWDILASNYLQPEYYTILGGSQNIHHTHFALFHGARLPRRMRAMTQGWGDSELRKCLDDIMDIVASKDGIAELMQEANVDIIKREGLSHEIATDQDDAIIKRYALFAQMKSIINMGILDSGESYERNTLQMGGVSSVIETFMTWISGAADIPLTRLFGTSAKGLNATGDGDLSNYFNSIKSKQVSQINPALKVIDEVIVRSALGHWVDDFNFTWNPLKQLSQSEIATAEKTIADRDSIYVQMGAVQLSQVQRNLQSSDTYQFDDKAIEELEAAEAVSEFSSLTNEL